MLIFRKWISVFSAPIPLPKKIIESSAGVLLIISPSILFFQIANSCQKRSIIILQAAKMSNSKVAENMLWGGRFTGINSDHW